MNEAAKNPEKYWADLEREIGESILFYTLGQRLPSNVDGGNLPIWGLFYITATRLFFRHFPKSGKFSFFGFGGSPSIDAPETFYISKNAIARIEIISEKRWWKKLFSSSLPVIIIEYGAEGGGTAEFRFSLERKQDEFLDLLRLQ